MIENDKEKIERKELNVDEKGVDEKVNSNLQEDRKVENIKDVGRKNVAKFKSWYSSLDKKKRTYFIAGVIGVAVFLFAIIINALTGGADFFTPTPPDANMNETCTSGEFSCRVVDFDVIPSYTDKLGGAVSKDGKMYVMVSLYISYDGDVMGEAKKNFFDLENQRTGKRKGTELCVFSYGSYTYYDTVNIFLSDVVPCVMIFEIDSECVGDEYHLVFDSSAMAKEKKIKLGL